VKENVKRGPVVLSIPCNLVFNSTVIVLEQLQVAAREFQKQKKSEDGLSGRRSQHLLCKKKTCQ